MHRRSFLHLAGAATAAAAAAAAAAGCATRGGGRLAPTASDAAVHAVAFDLFTLFDPRSVDRRVAALLPGVDAAAFSTVWKTRLFEYSWLRAAAGRYLAFDRIVVDALSYAERTLDLALAPAVRHELAAAFTALDPWPDTRDVLHRLRERGLRLSPLANYAPAMISELLASSKLTELFDHQLSTDLAQAYKPDPAAYALAERAFALPRQQIAFAAFGGWDAAGAAWFGFPTFWVNRLGVPGEELDTPDLATGPDLRALDAWLAA